MDHELPLAVPKNIYICVCVCVCVAKECCRGRTKYKQYNTLTLYSKLL
jgi:hypothetical protein